METKKYSFQRLKNYAEWYYFRYYPSNAKLLQKLQEKGTEEDSIQVFQHLEHLFQENTILETKIEGYISRNKNYRYIRGKMQEKWFPKEAVEAYLEKYKDSWESLLTESYLRKKISILKEKGKSRLFIFQKLWETWEDRILLEKILDEYFSEGEEENIQKEYEKLRGKYPKEKIFQKLIAKWFRYEEIQRSLDI